MDVLDMEKAKKTETETHMASAAAFVEGGIQDSCEDACSICLEDFSDSDPAAVTSCKHEYHLQCILEWCQRSSQCPMCLQSFSLKDPPSQELLEAVERERRSRAAPTRNATVFHHPTLGDFQLPVGASEAERIIQHLAAAAAVGRTHQFGRREGYRNQSSSHGHPHFLVLSTPPSGPRSGNVSTSLSQVGRESQPAAIPLASASTQLASGGDEPSRQTLLFSAVLDDQSSSTSGSTVALTNHRRNSLHNRQSSPPNQDRAGPSDLQSFTESLKSRLNSVSMRYKESISRSTRGWKERFFSRNTSMSDLSSEVRREANAGMATISRLMEHLETRDNRANQVPVAAQPAGLSVAEIGNQNRECPLSESSTHAASFAASPAAT